MTSGDEIFKEIQETFKTAWQVREGQKVPEPGDIKLGNDAVQVTGAVLYADLAESTELVKSYKDWFAGDVYKAYLVSACRIIRNHGGIITAFDGDRVMAVYIGNGKNSSAVRSALQINYVVHNMINVAIGALFPNTGYRLKQSVGIDTSTLFVARTGIRGSNDLVWIGRAANYAAKLCSLRDGGYASFITEEVYNSLADDAKLGGENKQNMWEKVMWNEQGIAVYRSRWWWKPE